MSTIDDPTIPDDLADLLRTASSHVGVSPASLRSVQHRARQRQRRRRAVVAGGATVALLLGGLAVAQAVSGSSPQRVVTATQPEPATLTGTAPQPLLLWGDPFVPATDSTIDPTKAGTWLDEITPGGPVHWWHSEPGSQAIKGAVLVDGRRYGLSVAQSTDGEWKGRAALDRIGPDGRTTSSMALSDPSFDAGQSIDLIGVSGSEVVLEYLSESEHKSIAGGGFSFTTFAKITALDVDTGAERTISNEDGGATNAAAADRLALASGTDCKIEVRSLHGSGGPRTVDGGCPPGIPRLRGSAQDLALSPDGRYAAVIWNEIRTAGSSVMELVIVDLDTGEVAHAQPVDEQWPITRIGWTGTRALAVAAQPGTPALPTEAGPVEVVTVRYRSP